jgi:YesN/AraC family two-component response regulator
VRNDLRLLIVDDEKIEREAVRFFASGLEPPFAAIAEAENGLEAVAAAREFRPDIIILDIRMPGKSGVEAAEEIRSIDGRARILFLTAYGELEYARAAFKVRADDFMVKPVSEQTFREAVGRAVASLEEAGALGAGSELLSGAGRRAAESVLLDAIRRGDPSRAEDAASKLLELSLRCEGGVQECRRAARILVAFLDRSLREEFGREFATGGDAMEALRLARDRREARECVLDAARSYAEEVADAKADPHRNAVAAALAFIEERWRTPISLEDASRAAGLSRFHFSRVFHAATGATFTDYLCAKRIERAKELLADPALPIKRICDLSGFSDAAYFSSAFKKREGLSPSEYRALSGRKGTAKLLNKSHRDETR